ncbi:porin [Falsiruegeria mediterranea]|jgi:Gram-negative porin
MSQKLKLTSAAALVATSIAAPAAAELRYENGNGGWVQLYGQFNPAITSVDDGQQSETNVTDSSISNSRIGVRGGQEFGANTFTFRFETGLSLPGSADIDQFGRNTSGWSREDIRHIDFALSGNYGKFSAGQGSMASDGAAGVDLSYVGTVLNSATTDYNDSFLFRDTAGALSGPTVGDTVSDLDGPRRTRLRYDTPEFNGFSAAIAYGQNTLSRTDDDDYYDIALNYANDFGAAEFQATIAHLVRDRANGAKRSDTVGSASVKLQNGLSFTMAAGNRSDDAAGATDPSYVYGKIAYEQDWFSIGTTGIGIHYKDGSDFDTNGSKTKVIGIGVAQRVDPINADVYFGYQQHEHDAVAANYQDNTSMILGARWKF